MVADAPRGKTPPDPAARGRRSRVPESTPELPLFAVSSHPLAEELRRVRPEGLTPIEALNLIARWKEQWGGE
jgi:hypothetical protein